MATEAKALFLLTVRRLFSACKDLLRVSSGTMVNAEQQAAMLKLLAGDRQVIELAESSSEIEANGVYL